MENIPEFERQFAILLEIAKEKLKLTEDTLAFLLLREGTAFYFKAMCRRKLEEGK